MARAELMAQAVLDEDLEEMREQWLFERACARELMGDAD